MRWINRVKATAKGREDALEKIIKGQTDERILGIYETHKDNPKIRWKDSIREVIEQHADSSIPIKHRTNAEVKSGPISFTINFNELVNVFKKLKKDGKFHRSG